MDLSSISNYEYATFKATWLNLTDPYFQCSIAESALSKRKDSEIVIKTRRLEKGCGVMTSEPKVVIDEIGYHSCLCHPAFQNPDLHIYIKLSDDYDKGLLPYSGGVLEQPAKIMEAIALIDSLKYERNKKIQEQETKRNKHGQ